MRDLVGIAEICELAGLARSTVDTYRWKGLLPEPDYVVSGHPIWERSTIDGWIRTRKEPTG